VSRLPQLTQPFACEVLACAVVAAMPRASTDAHLAEAMRRSKGTAHPEAMREAIVSCRMKTQHREQAMT